MRAKNAIRGLAKKRLLLLALVLLIAGAALAVSYTSNITFNITLNIIISKLKYAASYSSTLGLFLSKLQQIGAYTISLGITIGQKLSLAPYTISLGLMMGKVLPTASYSSSLSLILGASKSLAPYSIRIGICCNFSAPPPGEDTQSVIIRGSPTLSFALMLAIIGVPALLLASAAGPPGLFVGLLIGGGMAFMAGLLPLWFIVLLGLAVITLIAFMIRSRHD